MGYSPPLPHLGVHPRPAGDVGALTSWGPVLLLAAGEAAPTSSHAPHEVWVFAYSSLAESRQLMASDWEAALPG